MEPNSAYVLRPAKLEDLPSLVDLVSHLTDSITSIPQDKEFLEKRIHKSLRAFYPNIDQAGDEQYLFVLEGPEGIVGTSAIIARVGGFQPFYTYKIERENFANADLKLEKSHPTLTLKASHDGPTEIGSLYLRPDCRHSGLGRLLSLGRFLFIARFPKRFRSQILAELRGFLDEQGKSPFWEQVAKPFFEQEFSEADFLSGLGNKSFIRDLMPRHPLYTELLPQEVQSVIGRVHNHTAPAKAILEREGFEAIEEVDIFDAGPILQASRGSVRCLKEARSYEIESLVPESELSNSPWLAANGQLDYKACITSADTQEDSCSLSEVAASSLGLQAGDTVWLTPLFPKS
ncbi:arginine N-succinyltransferase [Pelagicoccus mobilis]|uniref:Arginine N-succinyltransferase n=1 Tax=Pelagicoccus mobilis TaxID=415221 RepID=A0A934RVL6_9BACT|nr:arginine N-succinyltransferase [Pelagicoccus mobilis]MBK1875969.1 arginine N-succinyltransferase [Pelagicoccus mobilis]